jgi:hypothetical protein
MTRDTSRAMERVSAVRHTFTVEDVTVGRLLACLTGAGLLGAEAHHG